MRKRHLLLEHRHGLLGGQVLAAPDEVGPQRVERVHELADEVMTVLAEEGLPADLLVLELTESVLLQAGRSTITTFHKLRDAGIGIAIDDFGTGYASLRHLAELPVSAVKTDRSFTAGLPHDPTCATIVRAVAGLARDLDLRCVIEGVETTRQLQALPPGASVQGYLLGRPGTVAAGSAAIDNGSARAWPAHSVRPAPAAKTETRQ